MRGRRTGFDGLRDVGTLKPNEFTREQAAEGVLTCAHTPFCKRPITELSDAHRALVFPALWALLLTFLFVHSILL